jgi:predicted DNA-binding transcriptional regulator AlpA
MSTDMSEKKEVKRELTPEDRAARVKRAPALCATARASKLTPEERAEVAARAKALHAQLMSASRPVPVVERVEPSVPQQVSQDNRTLAQPPPVVRGDRLIAKKEVLDRVGVSYPALWAWMRSNYFPHGYALGNRTVWLESEVDCFLASLPRRKFKGEKAE